MQADYERNNVFRYFGDKFSNACPSILLHQPLGRWIYGILVHIWRCARGRGSRRLRATRGVRLGHDSASRNAETDIYESFLPGIFNSVRHLKLEGRCGPNILESEILFDRSRHRYRRPILVTLWSHYYYFIGITSRVYPHVCPANAGLLTAPV